MNPTELKYSDIQNLIQSTEQTGNQLACVFACPVSGKLANAKVDIVKANGDALQTKVKARLRESAIKSITRTVTRALRSVLGSNAVGRLAGDLAKDKAKSVSKEGGFDADELQRATVVAFEKVQSSFAWGEAQGGFVHSSVSGKAAPARISASA